MSYPRPTKPAFYANTPNECPPDRPFWSEVTGRCIARKPLLRANSAKDCPPQRNLWNPITQNCIGNSSANQQRIASYAQQGLIQQMSQPVKQQFNQITSQKNYQKFSPAYYQPPQNRQQQQQRPSPSAHAKEFQYQQLRGNDGQLWESRPDKNNVFRWRRVK